MPDPRIVLALFILVVVLLAIRLLIPSRRTVERRRLNNLNEIAREFVMKCHQRLDFQPDMSVPLLPSARKGMIEIHPAPIRQGYLEVHIFLHCDAAGTENFVRIDPEDDDGSVFLSLESPVTLSRADEIDSAIGLIEDYLPEAQLIVA